jgi:hypothetical protein
MALFVIERTFAEELELSPEKLLAVEDYNVDAGLRWLFSFLTADRKKTYCVYEAPDAVALRAQAADLGLPADVIVEVSEVNPAVLTGGSTLTGHGLRY